MKKKMKPSNSIEKVQAYVRCALKSSGLKKGNYKSTRDKNGDRLFTPSLAISLAKQNKISLTEANKIVKRVTSKCRSKTKYMFSQKKKRKPKKKSSRKRKSQKKKY